jgi:hypothetical protein
MKYLKYLRYLARHKWYVLLACWRRGLYWQGLAHDWSKFLPDEFFPYAEFFYGYKPTKEDRRRAKAVLGGEPWPSAEHVKHCFDVAWLKHQHRNPHHWQHWILREDSGALKMLEMPMKYRLEMVCDWEGAGRAITGKIGGTREWYEKNATKMSLGFATRITVENKLGVVPF